MIDWLIDWLIEYDKNNDLWEYKVRGEGEQKRNMNIHMGEGGKGEQENFGGQNFRH